MVCINGMIATARKCGQDCNSLVSTTLANDIDHEHLDSKTGVEEEAIQLTSE